MVVFVLAALKALIFSIHQLWIFQNFFCKI